jgi:hypothetical protein
MSSPNKQSFDADDFCSMLFCNRKSYCCIPDFTQKCCIRLFFEWFTVLFQLFVAACRRFVSNNIPNTFICSFTFYQSGGRKFPICIPKVLFMFSWKSVKIRLISSIFWLQSIITEMSSAYAVRVVELVLQMSSSFFRSVLMYMTNSIITQRISVSHRCCDFYFIGKPTINH